ncbi:uncharacterized protein LOC131665930 [Phymastichus coffea]|uniref:uncharacterized protein LOC131665930 n=1 Tax=Phymastichus coffea TaxID=108790 RepID=UPI00273B8A68|nr:uncharacterized protein LOC131665930 [Phymastichus coffea]
MPSSSTKAMCLRLSMLLLFGYSVTSLIVPEELPTILSLIYSNIPPIKKGTDSRVGVGFRLGEHADFQVLVELGPQKETEPLGNDVDTKRKRAAMLTAAMRGELGPWAQAIAKYQMEQKLKQIIEKYKVNTEITQQNDKSVKAAENKSEANVWLSQWSQSLTNSSDFQVDESTRPKVLPNINRMKVVSSPTKSDSKNDDSRQNDLKTLKNLFENNTNKTISV